MCIRPLETHNPSVVRQSLVRSLACFSIKCACEVDASIRPAPEREVTVLREGRAARIGWDMWYQDHNLRLDFVVAFSAV